MNDEPMVEAGALRIAAVCVCLVCVCGCYNFAQVACVSMRRRARRCATVRDNKKLLAQQVGQASTRSWGTCRAPEGARAARAGRPGDGTRGGSRAVGEGRAASEHRSSGRWRVEAVAREGFSVPLRGAAVTSALGDSVSRTRPPSHDSPPGKWLRLRAASTRPTRSAGPAADDHRRVGRVTRAPRKWDPPIPALTRHGRRPACRGQTPPAEHATAW